MCVCVCVCVEREIYIYIFLSLSLSLSLSHEILSSELIFWLFYDFIVVDNSERRKRPSEKARRYVKLYKCYIEAVLVIFVFWRKGRGGEFYSMINVVYTVFKQIDASPPKKANQEFQYFNDVFGRDLCRRTLMIFGDF